jgi:hypothetical protein
MNRTRIEENLLILLDPSGHLDNETWRFIRTKDPTISGNRHHVIFSFSRCDLIRYFICSLSVKFNKKNTRVRKILHINDGLLCCLFSADNAAGYRAFKKRHVALSGGFRRRLSMLLPPILRAEQLFIAVEQLPDAGQAQGTRLLDGLDFMFYSNAPGKLLLTKAETFTSGTGHVFKTTSSPDYETNLKREYESVRTVSENLERPGWVPDIENPLRVNSRSYYPETYLSGEDLRSKLRSSGRSSSHREAIHFLDRLDDWFTIYHASFQGARKSLRSLYAQLFSTVLDLYTDVPGIVPLVTYAEEFLAGIDTGHRGLVPVLAHNDLWPGNFIVKGDRLTAIDWERATPQSTPLFDYFWMIISAVLEYRVGQSGVQDYSMAFRQFLSLDDDVCRHARTKLEHFLDHLGFGKSMHDQFILIFLMEWSVQGARALGVVTAMDRLAQGELMAFVCNRPDVFDLELSSGLSGTAYEYGENA